jgi:hypothetical protein
MLDIKNEAEYCEKLIRGYRENEGRLIEIVNKAYNKLE